MNVLSLITVAFLLMDELLALLSPFSSGLGLLLFEMAWCLFIFHLVLVSKTKWNLFSVDNRFFVIAAMLFVICYSILTKLISPCLDDLVFAFTTLLVVIFFWMLIELFSPIMHGRKLIEPMHATVGLTLVCIFLLVSTYGFDVYEYVLKEEVNRRSGIYLEPSHLALYTSPLIFSSLSHKNTRILGALLTLFLGVMAFSVVLVVILGLALLVYIMRAMKSSHKNVSIKSIAAISIAAIATLVILFQNDIYITDRINGLLNYEETQNWSSLVYLNGWLLAYSSFINTSGFGVGLGSMGCSEQINYDDNTLSTLMASMTSSGDITNLRDGSFLAAKLIAELGSGGIFLLIMCLLLLKNKFYAITVGISRLPLDGVVILAITLLFVRGLPYFSAPVVYCWMFLTMMRSNTTINNV